MPKRLQGDDWTPSPRQLAVLESAKESGLKRSITSICKRAGVTRQSFYLWRRSDPGFREAWSQIWRDMVDAHFPTAVSAVVYRARAGDMQAARLLSELKGVLTKQIELTSRSGGVVVMLPPEDPPDSAEVIAVPVVPAIPESSGG